MAHAPNRPVLSAADVLFLINTTQVGVGIFRMAREHITATGSDAWLVPLLGGLAVALLLGAAYALLARHARGNWLDLGDTLLSAPLNAPFRVAFFAYCTLQAAAVTAAFVDILAILTFPTIHRYILSLLLFLPAWYALSGGIHVLAKLGLFTFLITIWMVALGYYPLREADWLNLLPVLDTPPATLLRQAANSGFEFSGFEMFLFLFPYLDDRRRAFRAALWGHGITTLVYAYVVLITIVYFGKEQIRHVLYPLLDLFRVVALPVMERFEMFMLSLWLFQIVATVGAYLWMAAEILNRWPRIQPHRHVLAFVAALALYAALPESYLAIERLSGWSGKAGLALVVVTLLLYGIGHFVRKRGTGYAKGGSPAAG
ncbi:GerAB/ArcD/ProY family transporter [Calditerricola satsumensis]|uniref:Uncharacterized protein n=1 Tax=Calditerricola satsumensis TaxID=373054 RepID=A0A8J3F8K6_9BACI|nr:GerAB/ArcD/ProY family transporter [Calditerricola satsumensis]GGJ93400.1 hypothetical protein GCM10007043_03900 [Calditerricola satsumensis]